MKKGIHYFATIFTVFIFGYLLLHSNDTLAVSQPIKTERAKELRSHFNQGKIDFNQEGIQKESISLKSNQNQTNVNEVVRKQVQSLFVFTSFAQIELFQKNSFEVFFAKKNLLNLFLTTSRIIFPFHYFW